MRITPAPEIYPVLKKEGDSPIKIQGLEKA